MDTKQLLHTEAIKNFRDIVLGYYQECGRELAWREVEDDVIDPYVVTVSEIMLQQTQVSRVEQKFEDFIDTFPTMSSLARAEFSDVLLQWSGLGYNRRAKYLHEFAKELHEKDFPRSIKALSAHKGIGANTAAAILVYAFNQRQVFIETNIRSVMLHHFFNDTPSVSDTEILSVVEQTLPDENYREWYWALMDYGSFLKHEGYAHLHKALSHKKQLPFKGSIREIRSQITTHLLSHGATSQEKLRELVNDDRYQKAVDGLVKDGIIQRVGSRYEIC